MKRIYLCVYKVYRLKVHRPCIRALIKGLPPHFLCRSTLLPAILTFPTFPFSLGSPLAHTRTPIHTYILATLSRRAGISIGNGTGESRFLCHREILPQFLYPRIALHETIPRVFLSSYTFFPPTCSPDTRRTFPVTSSPYPRQPSTFYWAQLPHTSCGCLCSFSFAIFSHSLFPVSQTSSSFLLSVFLLFREQCRYSPAWLQKSCVSHRELPFILPRAFLCFIPLSTMWIISPPNSEAHLKQPTVYIQLSDGFTMILLTPLYPSSICPVPTVWTMRWIAFPRGNSQPRDLSVPRKCIMPVSLLLFFQCFALFLCNPHFPPSNTCLRRYTVSSLPDACH